MASQTNAAPSVDATATPQISVSPSLDTPVPQIVITEVPPLNQLQSTPPVVEDAAVTVPADVSARSAVPVATESDTPKQTELQRKDSSGEFTATEDCDQCVVPVPESNGDPTSEVVENPEVVETVTHIDRTETVESEEDEFRSEQRCCHVCGGCRGFYYRMADSLTSVYSIPFWFILLAIPMSAGFMGGRYVEGCPGRSTLPLLLFLLGTGGFIMLMAQLCYVIGNTVCREVESCIKPFMAHIAYTAGVVTFMALIAETVSFFTLKPDFNRRSRKFCHPTFYEYIRWMNYTTWLLAFLILAIRCPVACIRFNRSVRARHLISPVPPAAVLEG